MESNKAINTDRPIINIPPPIMCRVALSDKMWSRHCEDDLQHRTEDWLIKVVISYQN